MGGYAVAAVGAAGIGALAVGLKVGIAEFIEAAKVGAQTNAVLKSTGGVANVTAQEVSGLAEALMKKSGVDDEAIQSGENMLLTFTKVRNEVGAGNDIFNQATKATLDLSVAMGKDMPASALLVGKALNDPLKGMTALTRAGIQFTDAQKQTIAAMMESGNVMGAQKIILGELTTQFGGSAEAIGKTLPGQINVLKESFSNLAGNLVATVIPSFTSLVNSVNENWPRIEQVATQVFGAVSSKAGELAGFIQTHWNTIKTVSETAFRAVATALQVLVAAAQVAWPRIRAAAEATLNWYEQHLAPTIVSVSKTISSAWDAMGRDVATGTDKNFGGGSGGALGILKTRLDGMKSLVNAFLAVLRGDWSTAWAELKNAVKQNLMVMVDTFKGIWGAILSAARQLGLKAIEGIVAGLSSIGSVVSAKLAAVPQAVMGMVGAALAAGAEVGRAIGQGIINGLGSMAGAVADRARSIASSAWEAAKGFLGAKSPSTLFAGLGRDTVAGYILGITETAPQIAGKMAEAIQKGLDAAKAKVESAQGALGAAFGNLGEYVSRQFAAKTEAELDKLASRFDRLIARVQARADAATPAEKELAAIDAAEAQRTRDRASQEADAQLVAAQAMEEGVEKERAIAAAKDAIRVAALGHHRAALEAQAEIERAAQEASAAKQIAALEATKARELQNLTERRSQQATKLDEQLADLAARLAKHPEEYDKIQKKIQALLASYGVPMRNAGLNLGKAFAKGLDDSADAVERSAKNLARIVQKYLQVKSPTEKGPMSNLDRWWSGFSKTLLRGVDYRAVAQASARLAETLQPSSGAALAFAGAGTSGRGASYGTAQRVPLAAAGGGSLEVHNHFNAPIYADERGIREMTSKIRAEIKREMGRR